MDRQIELEIEVLEERIAPATLSVVRANLTRHVPDAALNSGGILPGPYNPVLIQP